MIQEVEAKLRQYLDAEKTQKLEDIGFKWIIVAPTKDTPTT